MVVDEECVFCGIVAGLEPAEIVAEWWDCVAFVPLNRVCVGHTLIVARDHVRDGVVSPYHTGMTFLRAAEFAAGFGVSNILTSVGVVAAQSVMDFHVHVVPRRSGDELMLPWGTTGDPLAPHRCTGMDQLEAELRRTRGRDEVETT
jgi:histidine triad (HIT) family protein